MPGERLKLQLQRNLDSNCRAAGGLAIQKRQFLNKAGAGVGLPALCTLAVSLINSAQRRIVGRKTSTSSPGTAFKQELYLKDGMFKEVKISTRSLFPAPGRDAFIAGSHNICAPLRQLSPLKLHVTGNYVALSLLQRLAEGWRRGVSARISWAEVLRR